MTPYRAGLPAGLLAALVLTPVPADAQSASASPSPSCSAPYGSPSARIAFAPLPSRTVVAGELVTVEVAFTGALRSASVYLTGYDWETPTSKGPLPLHSADGRVQHRDTHVQDVPAGETVRHAWTLAPTTSTRVSADVFSAEGNCGSQGHGSRSVGVLDVAPRLTLDAVRNGVRDYTFSGQASRDDQVLSLYRVTANGSQVLTAQTRSSGGRWSLRRVFTGSGRFGFVVRTGRDMANAAGASTVRPTLVH